MWKLVGVMSIVLAFAALAAASSAPAKGGGTEIVKRGSCSGSATWKLKAKMDGAFIETEFEVDQNAVGKDWRVVIRQNGIKRFQGIKTTKAPSGSFTVHRRLADTAGADRIVGKATALATGQTCRGALTI
jgi:ABC-type glycerol-3-phosphate transport system substrate-binding protein